MDLDVRPKREHEGFDQGGSGMPLPCRRRCARPWHHLRGSVYREEGLGCKSLSSGQECAWSRRKPYEVSACSSTLKGRALGPSWRRSQWPKAVISRGNHEPRSGGGWLE